MWAHSPCVPHEAGKGQAPLNPTILQAEGRAATEKESSGKREPFCVQELGLRVVLTRKSLLDEP